MVSWTTPLLLPLLETAKPGGGTAYRLERIDFADFGWPQKRQSPPAIETSGRAARELLGKK